MRIMVLEFKDYASPIFDGIMDIVNRHPNIEYLRVKDEQVLTYDQIYRKVWGEDAYGDESNAISATCIGRWNERRSVYL